MAGLDDALDGAAHRRSGRGHLQQHGVTGHQAHDDFTERNRQGIVPGADDAHDAQGQAADLGALIGEQQTAAGAAFRRQDFLRVTAIPLAGESTGQHFGGQGIDQRLAVAFTDYTGQFLGVVTNVIAHALDVHGPFPERFGRPDPLSLARLLETPR